MDKSISGKYMILLFTTLLLLIISCATIPPGQPIDLTGVWTGPYESEGCNTSVSRQMTYKITQEGNKITFISVERNNLTFYGILNDNIVAIKEFSYPSGPGIVIVHDFNFVISEDVKTIKSTGKYSFARFKGGPIVCTGEYKSTYMRKSEK